MVACLSPAITPRQSPPSPLPRQPAWAADECGLWLGAIDREPGHHHWQGHYANPKVCASKKTFSPEITTAIAQATAVVRRLLTCTPMTSRREVSMTSGISANGIPNERTTWLRTSALVGLTPIASTTSAGSIVMTRRTISGMRRLTKPAMTIWPAYVPTLEDEDPEASSATANASAAPPPTRCEKPA